MTAVNVYMEKNGDLRTIYEPNDNDFSQNSGQIFTKFDFMNIENQIRTQAVTGSGTLIF